MADLKNFHEQGSDGKIAEGRRPSSEPSARFRSSLCDRPRHGHYFTTLAQHVEMIGPPLRHLDPLLPEAAARIGASHRVGVLMRQRTLDGVCRKSAALVQERRSRGRSLHPSHNLGAAAPH